MSNREAAKLRRIAQIFDANKNRIERAALNNMLGVYLNRIFKRGLSTSGKKLGKYISAYWKKFRQSIGRQVANKDLRVTGDLMRSVQQGVNSSDNVIGFTNDMARKIAEGQQGQVRMEIFNPSDSELALVDKAVIDQFDQIIKESLA